MSLILAGVASAAAIGVSHVESAAEDGVRQTAPPTPTDNTTRHERPDRLNAAGDLVAVRRWLSGRMALQLEDCVVDVGAGTTDVCAFRDEYPTWLEKYVDVAGDTSDETDDRLGETFGESDETAERYSSSVSAFRETYRAYREAERAGDDARARALARQLQREGTAVDRSGLMLVDQFTTIERGAEVDLSTARADVNETRSNVSAILDEVEQEQFERTTLTAEISPETISFLEPGRVTGRLTTANGTPIANRSVRLVVGDRRLETGTDADGEFALTYRPTTLPLSTDTLAVRYRPRNESAYLASQTSVPVAVEQVQPETAVDVSPAAAGFGDSLTITGRVSAEGIGAPGIPVVVTVDGRRIGTVRTDGSGAFTAEATIAAADGPGTVEVVVALPLEDRALAADNASTSLTVERTATTLTLDASADGATTVDVSGALRTTDGVAVPDQPVAVAVDGTTVETLRTAADGSVRGTVAVPSAVRAAAPTNATVTLRFDGRGTNLRGSNASLDVSLGAVDGGDADGSLSGIGGSEGSIIGELSAFVSRPVRWLPGQPPVWQLLAVGALIALLAVGYRRWRGQLGPAGSDGSDEPSDGPPSATEESAPAEAPAPPTSPLDGARDRLSTDPDAAVMLAYAAVRRVLTEEGPVPLKAAETHWEFLTACRADGLGTAELDGLTRLTEAYEHAAYAETTVSNAAAESALETADGLV